MEDFFKYFTPVTYWLLIIVWSYILIFYFKKIRYKRKQDKLLGLLLLVLSIDAFRTLFESIYFGAWYTSLSGLLPIEVFDFLAQPQIVFFPKIINLLTAILLLIILVNRWLPSELIQKDAIKNLIEEQNLELLEKNKELKISTNEIGEVNRELELAKEKSEISEKYLENIINNIGDPVFVKDDQSRLILVNDSFCNLFSLDRDSMIGKTLAEEVPLDEQERFLSIDKEVIETGKENINEETFSVKGMQSKIISTRKSRFIDKNGNKILIGVIRDITDQKKDKKELLLYHNQLQKLVEQRTRELEEEVEKLDSAVKVFVGREQKINELKETVKTFENKIKTQ